jgi:hypothetical protein
LVDGIYQQQQKQKKKPEKFDMYFECLFLALLVHLPFFLLLIRVVYDSGEGVIISSYL